jgi:hypothetical protein
VCCRLPGWHPAARSLLLVELDELFDGGDEGGVFLAGGGEELLAGFARGGEGVVDDRAFQKSAGVAGLAVEGVDGFCVFDQLEAAQVFDGHVGDVGLAEHLAVDLDDGRLALFWARGVEVSCGAEGGDAVGIGLFGVREDAFGLLPAFGGVQERQPGEVPAEVLLHPHGHQLLGEQSLQVLFVFGVADEPEHHRKDT